MRVAPKVGIALLVALALIVAPLLPARAETASTGLRGINLAGAEFSRVGTPVFDSPASFRYLASRGYTVVRLPFLWESVQPTLSAPLDTVAMGKLHQAVADAAASGLQVILDVHNYAIYDGTMYGVQGSFTSADFADLWTRLANEFDENSGVAGYGLMNEPRRLPEVNGVSGNERWKLAQQAALDAIRATGDTTCVLVSGYTAGTMGGWMNAANGQPVPYITDPANNFRWEAHHYWDAGSTGTYSTTYADAVAAGYGSSQGDGARTRTYFELNQWIEWLKKYNQKGYIGEFGWPSTQNAVSETDAAAWNSLAQMYLDRIDIESPDLIWTTSWATGSRWSAKYPLQFYEATDGVLTTALSNAEILEAAARKVLPEPVVVPPDVVAVPPPVAVTPESVTSVVPVVPAAKVRSSLKVKVGKKGKRPKLTVTVTSKIRATGTVTVRDKGKVVAKGKLVKGRVAIVLKLKRGLHKLVVTYEGSSKVLSSKKSGVRVRAK